MRGRDCRRVPPPLRRRGKAVETRIEPTVRDLEERIDPRLVAPGHCTGWRAKLRRTVAFVPCPLCSCFENYFCRIKDWRRSATRYDKFARNFVAAAALFGAICWIKLLGQTLV